MIIRLFDEICGMMHTLDRLFAQMISVIFHPICMVFYMFIYVMYASPQNFSTPDPRQKTFVILSFLALTVMFPLLGISLMRMQGLISSFQMKTKKERIGPLIVIAIFYLWLYVNIRKNTLVPDVITFFVLGAVISVFLGLFINSFSKISLHCMGAGGFMTGFLYVYQTFVFPTFDVYIPQWDIVLRISNDLMLLLTLIIAGLVGTARLLLNAHQKDEIYGGYVVGILSQMIAIQIYF
jgi:membrane-associated phospholipid phosphatase